MMRKMMKPMMKAKEKSTCPIGQSTAMRTNMCPHGTKLHDTNQTNDNDNDRRSYR